MLTRGLAATIALPGGVALLALLSFLGARAGLYLSYIEGNVSLLWPCSGIGLAALYLYGLRFAPGLFLGTAAATWLTGAPWAFVVAAGLVNMVEALGGAWLLRRFGFDAAMRSVRDVGLLSVIGLGATLVAGALGASALSLCGMAPWAAFPGVFSTWWMGDAMGVIILGAFLLSWSSMASRRLCLMDMVRCVATSAVVAFVTVVFFHEELAGGLSPLPMTFVLFPFLAWAAFRFGPPGATLATLATVIVAVRGTLEGEGPFALGGVQQSLYLLWAFMATTSLTTLLLAALVDERSAAMEALHETREKLRLEEEKAHLAAQLREAEADIQALEGLIPICSYCKKIRDDTGYWDRVESFLKARTKADFTHGICPECYDRVVAEAEQLRMASKSGA